MAGLVGVPARKRAGCPVPAIHVFTALQLRKDVDARDKRGHDGVIESAPTRSTTIIGPPDLCRTKSPTRNDCFSSRILCLPARKAIGSPCTQSDWSVGQNPVTDQIKTSHFASNPASTRPPIGAFRETERKRTAENGQRSSKPLTNARQFVSTVYWPPDRAAAIDDLGSPPRASGPGRYPPSPCGRDHFLSSYTAHHRHEFSRIKPINGLVQQGSPS